MRSTVPEEVKQFIEKLKSEGICRVTDSHKNFLFWSPYTNTKQPSCFIENAFKSHCPKIKHADYLDYVIASLPLITGTYFRPVPEKFVQLGAFETRLNIYRPFTSNSESSDCPLFLELLERLIPDDSERHYFTQWLAHIIQHPYERPSIAVMLTSEEGTGKGVLFHEIISPLVCNQSRLCASYDEFLGKHATALSDTLFVMLDDVKSSSDATITKMKSKISEKTVTIEKKYEQPFKQECYARIMLASNERRPLKLDKNDTRRWFVPAYIEHRESKEETQAFIETLISWLAIPDSLSKIYNYLATYSLEGFNAYNIAPTETLKSMVEMSVSHLESLVVEQINETPVFKLKDFLALFDDSQKDIAKSLMIKHCKQTKNLKDPLSDKYAR
ncbi:primase-helicase family protein, partial [Vibrio casei]|uniref:primase-helicase family protein n=1 Tax=Vibrio casei TaxID=673372 RepID=UPI003F970625